MSTTDILRVRRATHCATPPHNQCLITTIACLVSWNSVENKLSKKNPQSASYQFPLQVVVHQSATYQFPLQVVVHQSATYQFPLQVVVHQSATYQFPLQAVVHQSATYQFPLQAVVHQSRYSQSL